MTEAAGAGAAGGGAAAGAAGAGAGAAAGAAAGAGAGAAAPWYGDKIDATTVGFWQNKGIDPADPVAVASKLTEFYRNSERFVGAPPEEMIRIPKANAAEADVKAYWGRIGVPAEAKDYDLSAVKYADGKVLEPSFSDTLREALYQGRVPKDRAGEVAARLVKHQEAGAAAALAEKTAIVTAETAALDKNWGPNKAANLVAAEAALTRLGEAAGLTPEQTKKGWDAISGVGGIGASFAMEMLRVAGTRMTLPGDQQPFIGGGQGGGAQVMSQAAAQAEIQSLKMDSAFRARLLAGDTESTRKWNNLHKVGYPRPQVA
jgi:hypothetical protein